MKDELVSRLEEIIEQMEIRKPFFKEERASKERRVNTVKTYLPPVNDLVKTAEEDSFAVQLATMQKGSTGATLLFEIIFEKFVKAKRLLENAIEMLGEE